MSVASMSCLLPTDLTSSVGGQYEKQMTEDSDDSSWCSVIMGNLREISSHIYRIGTSFCLAIIKGGKT